jgi:hypothetical protein
MSDLRRFITCPGRFSRGYGKNCVPGGTAKQTALPRGHFLLPCSGWSSITEDSLSLY